MARANYECPPERFVVVWQKSNNVAEVAETLGMPAGIVSARASHYRSRGVKLKRFPRGKTPGGPEQPGRRQE